MEALDIELWKPATFARYIVQKLAEKNITYTIKAPSDYIILGRLLKNFRSADKTRYALKLEIDKIFETKTFNYVNSLSFLWSLIKLPPRPKKEKRIASNVVFLSENLKTKLKELKVEINA